MPERTPRLAVTKLTRLPYIAPDWLVVWGDGYPADRESYDVLAAAARPREVTTQERAAISKRMLAQWRAKLPGRQNL